MFNERFSTVRLPQGVADGKDPGEQNYQDPLSLDKNLI
jgi:hypothetical protein